MKKVMIVAVCLALVLTLAFTLGALGKKPPGKLEYVIDFTGDVKGMEVKCVTQGRYISSSSIDRPLLTLDPVTFGGEYVVEHDEGLYLDLSEHKGAITMQYFFTDMNNEKVQLNVYGDGEEGELDGDWLSSSFTIQFVNDPAEILPTKRKRIPHWEGSVNITVVCEPQE